MGKVTSGFMIKGNMYNAMSVKTERVMAKYIQELERQIDDLQKLSDKRAAQVLNLIESCKPHYTDQWIAQELLGMGRETIYVESKL